MEPPPPFAREDFAIQSAAAAVVAECGPLFAVAFTQEVFDQSARELLIGAAPAERSAIEESGAGARAEFAALLAELRRALGPAGDGSPIRGDAATRQTLDAFYQEVLAGCAGDVPYLMAFGLAAATQAVASARARVGRARWDALVQTLMSAAAHGARMVDAYAAARRRGGSA